MQPDAVPPTKRVWSNRVRHKPTDREPKPLAPDLAAIEQYVDSLPDNGSRLQADVRQLIAALRQAEEKLAQISESHQAGEWVSREEHEAVVAELRELRVWARQVTDAIDGRPMPPEPDLTPAKIVRLRAEHEQVEAQNERRSQQLYEYEALVEGLHSDVDIAQARIAELEAAITTLQSKQEPL